MFAGRRSERKWGVVECIQVPTETYYNAGVRIFDIVDPFQPREVGYYVPLNPERMMDPRPNRPRVIQSADAVRVVPRE